MEPLQDQDMTRYIRLVYTKRYIFTAVALGIMAAAVVTSYTLRPQYEAKTVVLIERNFINQLIKDITVTPSLDDRVNVLSVVMKSRSLLLKVIAALDPAAGSRNPAELERLVKHYQNKTEIRVDINKGSRRDMDSFAVAYQGSDPAAAMTYVNTLMRVYIEENIAEKREEAYGAGRFVSEQLNLVKNKMHAVEQEIELLKSAEATKDVNGTSLQKRLVALQKKQNELLMTYTTDHPDVIKVKSEIAELQTRADKELARTDITPQSDAPRSASPDRKKLSDLERDREAYKKIYEDLIATLGKSEVSTQVQVQDKAGTFRVIDPAILPTKPVSPNRVKILLLGIMAGIAGGFGFVLLLNTFDDSVKTLDALKGFGVPVLAVIPSIWNAAELVKRRRADLILYSVAAVAMIGVLSLVMAELLGVW